MQTVKDCLAKIVKWFIQSKLTNETKRIVVLSSLAARLETVADPAQRALHKLNNILHLCHDDKALLFPMYISNAIWGSREDLKISLKNNELQINGLKAIKDHELTKTQIQIVASLIVNLIPDYLSYASKRMMRGDIALLLRQVTGGDELQTKTVWNYGIISQVS